MWEVMAVRKECMCSLSRLLPCSCLRPSQRIVVVRPLNPDSCII